LLVILYYDYLLTLPLECSRYWGSRITLASGFFYLNRYLALLGHIPVVFRYFWTSSYPDRIGVGSTFLHFFIFSPHPPFQMYVFPVFYSHWLADNSIYSCVRLSSFHHYLALIIQSVAAGVWLRFYFPKRTLSFFLLSSSHTAHVCIIQFSFSCTFCALYLKHGYYHLRCGALFPTLKENLSSDCFS
jgi:hypothetical protein